MARAMLMSPFCNFQPVSLSVGKSWSTSTVNLPFFLASLKLFSWTRPEKTSTLKSKCKTDCLKLSFSYKMDGHIRMQYWNRKKSRFEPPGLKRMQHATTNLRPRPLFNGFQAFVKWAQPLSWVFLMTSSLTTTNFRGFVSARRVTRKLRRL